MENMSLREFKRMVLSEDDNISIISTDEQERSVLKDFSIICKKCGHPLTKLIGENNVGCSDMSGMWGSVDLVFKCDYCGNASSVIIIEP